MDNHQHNGSMMWLMMIGCAVPLLFTLFIGSANGFRPILTVAALAVMFGLHFFMMRRHHRDHDDH